MIVANACSSAVEVYYRMHAQALRAPIFVCTEQRARMHVHLSHGRTTCRIEANGTPDRPQSNTQSVGLRNLGSLW